MRIALWGGGGEHGAVQPVVARKILIDNGIKIDLHAGTSVGAVTGCKLAMAEPGNIPQIKSHIDALDAIWTRQDDRNLLDGIRGFCKSTPFSKTGFFSLEPLLQQLHENDIRQNNLKAPFAAGVVVRESCEHKTFLYQPGAITPDIPALPYAIIASSAIAALFEPVICNKETLSDGGHYSVVVPVQQLPVVIDNSLEIHAIFCKPLHEKKRSEQINGRIEAMIWAIEMAHASSMKTALQMLSTCAAHGAKVYIYAPDRVVGTLLDARKETIEERREIARTMADRPYTIYSDGEIARL